MEVEAVFREEEYVCTLVFDRLAELVVLVERHTWLGFGVGSGFQWWAVDVLKADSMDVLGFLVGDPVTKLLFIWAWGKLLVVPCCFLFVHWLGSRLSFSSRVSLFLFGRFWGGRNQG